MVVCEAPAREEVRLGRPLVGRSGQEHDRLWGSVGVKREDIYTTNASLEPVQGDKYKWFFESDGKPTQVLMRGLAALMADINEIHPNVVVPMGNYALWAMRQHMDIMRWRGSIVYSKVFKVKCVPTIHPAALLWGGSDENRGMYKYRPVIIWDLERAKEQSKFPETRLRPRTFLIDPQGAERDAAIQRLLSAKRITWDTEAPKGKVGLKCVSFSDFDPGWAVCFWHTGQETLELFRMILESDIPKVGQNLMYDVGLFDQLGIHARNIEHDTMLAQHVIHTDLPKGLDFMASVYSDIPYYKDEGKEWADGMDTHKLMVYCCKDNCATTDAAMDQMQHLGEEPDLARTFRISMKVFDPLRWTTFRGIAIDRPLLQAFINETEAKRAKYQKEVDKEAGFEVNVMSHVQVKHLIFDIRKLPRRTTTQQDVLMDLAAKTKDRLLVNIVVTRRARKLLSSYYRHDLVSPDGRMRWEYKIAGAKTFRLSCQKPSWGPGLNGQTIPWAARRMFVPDEGWEFCEGDGMQAETIVTAALCMDPIHLDCFRTGKDVHRVTACLLMDMDPAKWAEIPKESKVRQLGKTCNHAFNYEMGPVTFMLTVNVEWDPEDPESLCFDQDTATAVREKYLSIRPALQNYWQWVRNCLSKDRTLVTPLGQRFIFLDQYSDTMFKDGYSRIPQSTVGIGTNIGILQVRRELERRKLTARFVAQTHDSALWTYPKEQRDEVVPVIMHHSEVPLQINGLLITVPIEVSVGGSWYKLKPKDPPEWRGLKPYGVSRETIDVGADEFQVMMDRMAEAID